MGITTLKLAQRMAITRTSGHDSVNVTTVVSLICEHDWGKLHARNDVLFADGEVIAENDLLVPRKEIPSVPSPVLAKY